MSDESIEFFCQWSGPSFQHLRAAFSFHEVVQTYCLFAFAFCHRHTFTYGRFAVFSAFGALLGSLSFQDPA